MMRNIFLPIATTLVVVGCGECPTDTAIQVQDLDYEVGDAIVTETTLRSLDTIQTIEIDTLVVRNVGTDGSNKRVEFFDGSGWMITASAFSIFNGSLEFPYCQYPAVNGRWASPIDTIIMLNPSGLRLDTVVEIATTIATDTIIETSSGTYRCVSVMRTFEGRDGSARDDLGNSVAYVSKQYGLVRFSTRFMASINNTLQAAERRTDMISIRRASLVD